MLQQQFALLSDNTRGRLLGLLSLILIAGLALLGSPFSSTTRWPAIAIFGAVPCIAVFTFFNLRARGQSQAAVIVVLASVVLSSPLLWVSRTHHSVTENLLLYRMAWLQSGVSPTLPLLLVCAALFSWAWFNLKLHSLFDYRSPLLPRGIPELPSNDLYATGAYSLTFTRSPVFWAGVALMLGIVVSQDIDPRSLDGTNFNDLYRVSFMLCLVLVANSIFSAWETWRNCRVLLQHLDRTPLRWAFRRIEGFSWKPLWGASGVDLMGAYKPLSRSLEAFKHLQNSLSMNLLPYLQGRVNLVDNDLQQLRSTFASAARSSQTREHRSRHDTVVYRMHTLQKNLAVACSLVWLLVLDQVWESDVRLVTTGKQVRIHPSNALQIAPSNESVQTGRTQLEVDAQSICLAEEFISLTYLNFIHRVLLRLRWLILAAVSAFVLLLFSVKLYPFEPQGRINGFLILLFLAIASVVYMIYSQMHRDATLSHLTRTKPGELGVDFWVKMISLGAVPTFSLLATQLPALNRFFYTWLKPVLDALHRS